MPWDIINAIQLMGRVSEVPEFGLRHAVMLILSSVGFFVYNKFHCFTLCKSKLLCNIEIGWDWATVISVLHIFQSLTAASVTHLNGLLW